MSKILIVLFSVLYHAAIFASEQTTNFKEKKEVNLTLAVIWEGSHMYSANLNAIKLIREKIPQVKFMHLVSPVYFVRSKEKAKDFESRLKSVVSPVDQVGLYLSPWKSLVEESKVKFRTTPSIWGEDLTKDQCLIDCGSEIPLSAYSKTEIDKLIKFSLGIFQSANLPVPEYFMAGSWMAPAHVLEIAQKNGLKYDVSGIPTSLLEQHLGEYPSYSWLKRFHKNIRISTQPLTYHTKSGPIIKIFNNLGSLDYQSEEQIFKNFLENTKKLRKENQYMMISFYQETAHRYHERLNNILDRMIKYSQDKNMSLTFFEGKVLPNLPVKNLVQSTEKVKKSVKK